MNIKLLTEHHLEFPSLKGDCTGSSESIHANKPHIVSSLSFKFQVYSNHSVHVNM